MKNRFGWCALAVVLLARVVAADTARYEGTFAGEKFKIELASKDGGNYSGTIFAGEQKYPVVARETDKGLSGEFEANGKKYPFEAVRTDAAMTLVTGGATHALKKAVINPLGITGGGATG